MIRTALVSAWVRKRRLAGTVGAVLLGVAFLTATLVLGDTARAGFADVFDEVNDGTDVVVRSTHRLEGEAGVQQGLLDIDLVDQVRAVDGVAVAEGRVEAVAQVLGSDGRPVGGDGPPTIAASWTDDPDLNPFRIAEGRPPEADDEVVLDRGTAETGDLAVGDRTTVLTPAPREVTVVGIAAFGDEDGIAGATFVGFTPAAASSLLPRHGAVTSVVVVADEGIEPAALASRIAAELPGDVEAVTVADVSLEQQDSVEEDFLGFLEAFLLVFAGVALLVAASSVHNTASILVAQRTRESALLRAVGASRGQVLAATLVEALLVGFAGALAGAAVGVALATGLGALLEAADIGLPIGDLAVTGGAIGWPVAVGVVLSVLASVAPAVHASRVAPVAALRDVTVEGARPSRWRAVLGVGATVVGAATVFDAADADSALATAGLGALLLVIGVVLLGPVVARPVASVLGAPLRGVTGRLARGGAERNPRRTAGTASALLVGVGVVTAFTVLADSLSSSIAESVDQAFAGDLVVESAGFSGVGLDPAFTAEVRSLPGVAAAADLGEGLAVVDGDEIDVTVTDPAAFGLVADVDVEEGELASVGPDGFVISSSVAEEEGWSLGTVVPVTFGDGTTADLRVDAVFANRSAVGDVLLPTATWEQHATQPSTFAVLVDLADDVDVEAGRRAVEVVGARYGSPDVLNEEEFVEGEAAEIRQVLTLVYGLLGVAIVIALLGIAGTLSLSIRERRRELGLLRAVGLDRRQLRAIVRGEAVIVSLLGTVGGLSVGVFVGWGLMRAAAAEEGLGVFTVPVGQLAVVLGLGGLAGVVAAVRPARRAAREPVLALASTG